MERNKRTNLLYLGADVPRAPFQRADSRKRKKKVSTINKTKKKQNERTNLDL